MSLFLLTLRLWCSCLLLIVGYGLLRCVQAISLSPELALPHVACCISMGRLAVFSDNKTKVHG